METHATYDAMLAAVQAFHDKHDFRNSGGEDLPFRVALMAEELGEISIHLIKDGNILLQTLLLKQL